MKMMGRFIGYVFSVLAILVITYGYVYWGNLFGEKTPAGQMMAWLSDKDKKDLDFFSHFSTSTTNRAESDKASVTSQETEVITEQPEAVAESVIEPAVVTADKSTEDVVIKTAEFPSVDQVGADVNNVEEQVAVLNTEKQQGVTGEVKSIENVLPESLPVDKNMSQSEPFTTDVAKENVAEAENMNELQKALFARKLLIQARQAFHYRDYQTSIASYQQLIVTTQDNFDAYGELGNVYYYLGKKTEAAAAYYEAAAILIRLGKIERASNLMGTLSLLDTTKARQLLDLLDAAR
ncbi:MAG: tetratricopeptide repeat protein [Gammaproteobacteria bacterium]|nr:tetratricopeptide repeat protein [Gammaproteobacteria bacterium]